MNVQTAGSKILALIVWLQITLAALGSEVVEPDAPAPAERNLKQVVWEATRAVRDFAKSVQSRFGAGESQSDHPYIGVVIESVPASLREHVDLPEGVGLLITEVKAGGPAEAAGIVRHDILVRFNDQWIVNSGQLSALIRLHGTESPAKVEILRKGNPRILGMTPACRGKNSSGDRPAVLANGAPVPPQLPELPPVPLNEPDSVGPPTGNLDVDAWLRQIESLIPSSVSLFVDENEQIRLDLASLKQDLEALRKRFQGMDLSVETHLPKPDSETGGEAGTTIFHEQ